MAVHASHAALPYPIRNARYTVDVIYLDADGDPTNPVTPDTEISKDNGDFADCAEEVAVPTTNRGGGMMTFSGAEMDCSTAKIWFGVASGPKVTMMTLQPRIMPIVGSGTLSAGSAGGGTLGTILTYDISGCFIRTTGGTGGGGTGGANNQAKRIMTYNQSTGAFTVSPDWETTPDNTTTYDILAPEGVTLSMLKTLIAGTNNGPVKITNPSGTALELESTGGNGHGLDASGNGSGNGAQFVAGATGTGLVGAGGSTSGPGAAFFALTLGYGLQIIGVDNHGVLAQATGTGGDGVRATGIGTGAGLSVEGGATGIGLKAKGGATSGDGAKLEAGGGGRGVYAVGVGATGDGILAQGDGAGNGLGAQGGTGREHQTNGDFATDTAWTKGTGITISGGKATHAAGSASSLSQAGSPALVEGVTHAVVYTISALTVGSVTAKLKNGAGTVRSANETYIELIAAGAGATDIEFAFSADCDGSIDDVHVIGPPGDGVYGYAPGNASYAGGGSGVSAVGAHGIGLAASVVGSDATAAVLIYPQAGNVDGVRVRGVGTGECVRLADDGTGNLKGDLTGNVSGSVGSVTGLTASDVGAIRAKTDNLPADPADQSLVIAATDQIRADIATVQADTDALQAQFNGMTEDDGAVRRFTTNALEQAPGGAGSNPNLLLDTTIATAPSQTSFTLTAGPADDDGLKNQAVVFYDASSGNDPSIRLCTDYVAATKTITIDGAPDFTVIAGDGIKFFVTAPGTTAPTAAQVSQQVWDEFASMKRTIHKDTSDLKHYRLDGTTVRGTLRDTVIDANTEGMVPQ